VHPENDYPQGDPSMPQWRVHFFITRDNKMTPSEMVVSATDRSAAVAIIQAMYGGEVSIRWVDML
jgi:hypothetical protein